jgi:hypothetical protein
VHILGISGFEFEKGRTYSKFSHKDGESVSERVLSVNAAVDGLDFLKYSDFKNFTFYSVVENESACFKWRDLYSLLPLRIFDLVT